MAKPKVKLDVTAIKKWLMANGEKVGFGATVLMLLLFLWGAILREVLPADKQPAQMQKTATDVANHLTSSRFDESTFRSSDQSYADRAERRLVAKDSFPLTQPFNPPLADAKDKRSEPDLLAIEEVKVAAGFGAFALTGGKLKGQAWVAITGLVPVQKQVTEYARIFQRAQGGDPQRDTPRYLGFKIERAEITDSDPAKLEWKDLPRAPIVKEFAAGPAEVVKAEFVDPALTVGLRPLVPPNWGDAVTHPKIPLNASGTSLAAPAVNAAPADEVQDAGGFQQAGGVKDPDKKAPPGAAAAEQPEETSLGVRLFRGFDFSVEPNKKYRYRVVVRLANPNFGVAPQYLADPNSAKAEFLDTKPTEPSAVVSVPDGYQILAGGAKPAKMGEPSAKVMLLAIEEAGVEANYELEVMRGSIANAVKDVTFKSDTVVLDIRGGKTLPGRGTKLYAPADLLLLDRKGDLAVRSELADEKQYATRKPADDEAEVKKEVKKPDPVERVPRPVRRPKAAR